MRAAVWYGGRDIRIEDVSKPKVKGHEVLVKTIAVGICSSELHAYEGISERRKPPLILGHEFSGEVVEIGKNVQGIERGERVFVDPITRCGTCLQCSLGRGNICPFWSLKGLHEDGAFAEYVSVSASNCHRLPDAVSSEEGVMIEPLSVAVHAVERAPIRLGDTVVIIGAGTIGLMLLQAAKIAGAGRILITDILDYRLNFAKKMGADEIINATTEDPIARVSEATGGSGADVVMEAVGLGVTVQQAVKMVRNGGRTSILGILSKNMSLDMMDVVTKEIDMKGSIVYTPKDIRAALTLVENRKADVMPLITNILPLERVVEGFELMRIKAKGVLKVMLKP